MLTKKASLLCSVFASLALLTAAGAAHAEFHYQGEPMNTPNMRELAGSYSSTSAPPSYDTTNQMPTTLLHPTKPTPDQEASAALGDLGYAPRMNPSPNTYTPAPNRVLLPNSAYSSAGTQNNGAAGGYDTGPSAALTTAGGTTLSAPLSPKPQIERRYDRFVIWSSKMAGAPNYPQESANGLPRATMVTRMDRESPKQ